MLYPFCTKIFDERLGVDILLDVECEVEISVEIDGGVPVLSVDGVFIEDKNLCIGGPVSKALAAAIASNVEDELENGWKLREQVLVEEGFVYRGMGGNDPDGRYERRT